MNRRNSKSRLPLVSAGRFAVLRPFWITGPAIVFGCWCVVSAWQFGGKQAGIDFYQMWAASQVQGRSGVANLYDPDTGARLGQEFIRRASEGNNPDFLAVAKYWKVLESFSSPFLYAVFRTLPSRDYLTAFDTYRTVCLAALVTAIGILGYLMRFTVAQTALLVGLCSRFFDPVLSDIRVGNVNQLQLLALAVAFYLVVIDQRWRRITGSAIVAAMILFKPNVSLVALALILAPLFQRRWRRLSESLAGLAVGSCFALALGSLSARSPVAWVQWIERMRTFPEAILARNGNLSLQRVVGARLPFVNPTVAAFAVVILLVGSYLRGSRTAEETQPRQLLLLTGALLGSILAPPLVWLHYLVLSIPAAMLLMSPSFPKGTRIVAVSSFVLIACLPFHALPVDRAIPMLTGTVLLFGLTLWHLSRSSPQKIEER
ncbi:MAG TPA: glycosyltransferase family 87 protein [Thermoanaerobaculia bacterium]|nr:glycosyltransferase family 87 protein [Thermoanaerobaculia bacterium]